MAEYIDVHLRSGWQVKTRWRGDGASTIWQWGNFYDTRDEADAYKTKHQGRTDLGWKLEIKIFRVESVD